MSRVLGSSTSVRAHPQRALCRAAPWAVAMTILTGCQVYRPVERARPGSTVRVHVPVISALADPNAAVQTAAVEGRVISASDTLVLAMTTRREVGGFRQVIQYDTLRVARAQLVGIEEQEFSGGRSIALGVTLGAGITGAILGAIGFGGGGGDPSDDGGGDTPAQLDVLGSLISLVAMLVGN